MTNNLKSLILTISIAALTLIGMTTSSQASSTIPKSFRGTWYSNITYTDGMKHVPANIAVPKVKLSVHGKTVYWRWYGTLGPHYNNHKTYKLTASNYQNKTVTLKGHGPYRTLNFLTKSGSKLFLMYQGGNIIFHKR